MRQIVWTWTQSNELGVFVFKVWLSDKFSLLFLTTWKWMACIVMWHTHFLILSVSIIFEAFVVKHFVSHGSFAAVRCGGLVSLLHSSHSVVQLRLIYTIDMIKYSVWMTTYLFILLSCCFFKILFYNLFDLIFLTFYHSKFSCCMHFGEMILWWKYIHTSHVPIYLTSSEFHVTPDFQLRTPQ